MKEIEFEKYKTVGVGYHWKQIGRSLRKRNPYVVARYKNILSLVGKDLSGKRVLDIGCGDGVLSYLLTQAGADVTGVDTSKEAIDFAMHKTMGMDNIRFTIASAYDLPFENRTFDTIVSTEVIEHLAHPETMLVEVKRVWSGKGCVVITTPVKLTAKPMDKMHYQEFFEEDFKALMDGIFKGYNIEIVKSHPLFWMEFQNKQILGHSINRIMLNIMDLAFGFNPHKNVKGWRFYTLQTTKISK